MHLDSGHQGTWTLDAGTLEAWVLGYWIPRLLTLGIWTPGPWALGPRKYFSFLVVSFSFSLIFNVGFLNIANGLRLMYYASVVYDLGILKHFEYHTKNIYKIHKDFELNKGFIRNFLSLNVSIPPNFILLTRTKSIFIPFPNF